MTPETPSSSGSDTSKTNQRSGEEKLIVTVRIRPVRPDESVRVLHAVDKKVKWGIRFSYNLINKCNWQCADFNEKVNEQNNMCIQVFFLIIRNFIMQLYKNIF